MITSKSGGSTRRTTPQRGGTATAEPTRSGRGRRTGVPTRALADGVIERRRTPRRPVEGPPTVPDRGESIPVPRSASEHYRTELQRRADRTAGDLAALLAEAKAEYEALLAAPRPAGKGGRPRKKPVVKEFDLNDEDALGPGEEEE